VKDIVERLSEDYCSCHPGYKDRGLIDPHCESCQTMDERHEATAEITRLRAEAEALRKAPDGFKWVCVKGLDPLLQALERADRKGYLPDAMADEWNEFEFSSIDATKGTT